MTETLEFGMSNHVGFSLLGHIVDREPSSFYD